MRFLFPVAAALLLAACSDSPTTAKPKAQPLAPLTGRQAFQATFPSARGWAADAEPIMIRSMSLSEVPAGEGQAGAWEITYVSLARSAARVYTWSAIDSGETLHQGVFAGQQQSWRPGGQQRSFPSAALKIDTPEALETARKNSEDYLAKPGKKPRNNYYLDATPRFADPAWRVLWGESVGTADHLVFVDASTGDALGKE